MQSAVAGSVRELLQGELSACRTFPGTWRGFVPAGSLKKNPFAERCSGLKSYKSACFAWLEKQQLFLSVLL